MNKKTFCKNFRKEVIAQAEYQKFTADQMKKIEVKRFLEAKELFRRRMIGYSALKAIK